ncbi:MAG: hypothetical protein ACKPKO_48105, partial [Candidatus Fonsibacter sp.]
MIASLNDADTVATTRSGGVDQGQTKGGPFPLLPLNTMLSTSHISKAKCAKRSYALAADPPAEKAAQRDNTKYSETPKWNPAISRVTLAQAAIRATANVMLASLSDLHPMVRK